MILNNPADYKTVNGITNDKVLINGEIMPVRDVMLENDTLLSGTAHPKCLRGEDVTFLAEAINRKIGAIRNSGNISFVYEPQVSRQQLNNVINPLHDYAVASYVIADYNQAQYEGKQSEPIYIKPDFVFDEVGGQQVQTYIPPNSWEIWGEKYDSCFWAYKDKDFFIKPTDLYTTRNYFYLDQLYGNDVRGCFYDVNNTRKFFNGKFLYTFQHYDYPFNLTYVNEVYGNTAISGYISGFPIVPEPGQSNILWFSQGITDSNRPCEKVTRTRDCSLTIDMTEIVPVDFISKSVICLMRFNSYMETTGPWETRRQQVYSIFPYNATIDANNKLIIPPSIFNKGIDDVVSKYPTTNYKIGNGTPSDYVITREIYVPTIDLIFQPPESLDFSNIGWHWTPPSP